MSARNRADTYLQLKRAMEASEHTAQIGRTALAELSNISIGATVDVYTRAHKQLRWVGNFPATLEAEITTARNQLRRTLEVSSQQCGMTNQ
jgi:hypothetical protein